MNVRDNEKHAELLLGAVFAAGKGVCEGLAHCQVETLFNTIRDLNAGVGEVVLLGRQHARSVWY